MSTGGDMRVKGEDIKATEGELSSNKWDIVTEYLERFREKLDSLTNPYVVESIAYILKEIRDILMEIKKLLVRLNESK